MKISEKKIEEIREFMSFGCDYSGAEETVNGTVEEVLKGLGSELLEADEITLTDGDEAFCTLDVFVRVFWEKSIELFLNVLSTEELD